MFSGVGEKFSNFGSSFGITYTTTVPTTATITTTSSITTTNTNSSSNSSSEIMFDLKLYILLSCGITSLTNNAWLQSLHAGHREIW